MGTICKYALLAEESDVVECVSSFLRANQKDFVQTVDRYPQVGEFVWDRFPTVWSARKIKDGVVEVGVNSWERASGFASFAASQLQTRLVVNHYQSNSDGCYWAYYLDGECMREIETTEEPLFEARGDKLSFEREQIGTNLSEDGDDPFFIFSYEDMDFYNNGVGVDIEVYEPDPPDVTECTNWTVIDQSAGMTPLTSSAKRARPFWRFWE